MPKYQCEDCGAIFYGWAVNDEKICKKCGGKRIPAKHNKIESKGPGQ